MKDFLFIFVQYVLPHGFISRLVSRLANSRNKFIKNYLINVIVKKFKINLQEAKYSEIDKYSSFNDFFTRELADEIRPLEDNPKIISSPADGVISQFGQINNKILIQAKGKTFSLNKLIANSSRTNFTKFATIYLSPRDYHRVHMPIDGRLTKMVYIPGKLFSVNKLTTEKIDDIFAKNERLVCYFDTTIGEIAVIFIGALLVAGIETVWHGKLAPNYYNEVQTWLYNNHKYNLEFKKGDTLGWFNFGSTVILLMPNDNINFKLEENNTSIKVNQGLAFIAE
ncbi:phosphatidylserine decarboxylase [Allofrancisella guangzhouensis]|uniref:Phosphatidylserine decarboxylase proenzyme n=1 Tax=Allofrancisella guangzhouensis TaxID=594679 RepID=A0A0A8E5E0_9GAMM|nr:archaetidylserine decarboxylase [Allofrancisella guangzhouensis]AJC49440.1 phosphatidylserine decarboxylase [Allofrancisella guangzhouensis]MBK2026731.1 phosphatidylserine decarboxylase [Allofrancisella guangzhouensis]MBK2043656.1 phosphatidylserine decarboxylase [Allofrancisella guangzhouensis]MBK2046189.1 phosphatidylserine decarboxylase [Allofrancisella guangzhouensis]